MATESFRTHPTARQRILRQAGDHLRRAAEGYEKMAAQVESVNSVNGGMEHDDFHGGLRISLTFRKHAALLRGQADLIEAL